MKWNIEPPKSFRPPLLSEEHARHVSKFVGYPVTPEEHASLAGWVAYKRWHHKELLSRK